MKISKIISALEQKAPPSLQETYDNAGLIVGNPNTEIKKALITVDATEEVVDEAITIGAGLIIAHHPIIFAGLKKLNGANYVERTVIKAIKHDIAIYAIHTNLDNIIAGTNSYLANLLGLKNLKVLHPMGEQLLKLVVFCPITHSDKVRDALFSTGAGVIGKYDLCSFNTHGKGSFRAGNEAKPFVGKKGEIHLEEEVRIETILPRHIKGQVLSAMLEAHPYEEVAYDIVVLENSHQHIGMGMVGELESAMNEEDFFNHLKKTMKTDCIRHSKLLGKSIKKVAVLGGSGSFAIRNAIAANADIYITADVKYHEFYQAENKLVIADIGHYESEQFTKNLLVDYLTEKITTFAPALPVGRIILSDKNTNPIYYK